MRVVKEPVQLRTQDRQPPTTPTPAGETDTPAAHKTHDAESLEKSTRAQRRDTAPTATTTTTTAAKKSSPVNAFFTKDIALPSPRDVFKAILALPQSATAQDAQALWQLGEAQGAIVDGKLHPLKLTIEDRRLHAMMMAASFDVASGVTPEELADITKRASDNLLKGLRDDDGIPWQQLGAFFDAREKELIVDAMASLGISRTSARRVLDDTPAQLSAFVPADVVERGLAAAVDTVPIGLLLAKVNHMRDTGERAFDPFVRFVVEELKGAPATRQSVCEAAVRVFKREYAGADGRVDLRHVDVPGKRMRTFHAETIARSVLWEAMSSAQPQSAEQQQQRQQARAQLDKTAARVASAMNIPVAEARDNILRSLQERHESDSLHSSLMMDMSGRIDTRTGEPLSMELTLARHLELWNGAADAIPTKLPMVERTKARLPDDAFKGHLVLTVQHFLGPFVPLMEALKAKGASTSDMLHVGVPYSANAQVELALRAAGNDVRVPSSIDDMKSAIRDAMAEMIERAKAEGKPILVIDDGGTVTELLQEVFPQEAHRFRIIEQTTRGITAATKAIEKGGFKPPVIVDVARSEAKALEGAQIAPTAIEVLENIQKTRALALRDIDPTLLPPHLRPPPTSLAQSKPIVFGFGVIGASMARALKEMGIDPVAVWDKDPKLRELARAEGFFVPDERDEIFKGRDLVIGCTGFPSIEAADFPKLEPYTLLTSLSSKRIEFDPAIREEQRRQHELALAERKSQVAGFNRLGTFAARATVGMPEQLQRDNNHTLVLQYLGSEFGRRQAQDNSAEAKRAAEFRPGPIVVNDMQPVNFDHDVFVVPAEHIQLTESLLLDGAYQAVLEAERSGIVAYDAERQRHVLDDWAELKPATPATSTATPTATPTAATAAPRA